MNYATFLHQIPSHPWHEIESALSELTRRHPNDPMPLVYGAHLSLRQGQPTRAKVLAEKAMSLDPNCEGAFVELALANFYLDDFEQSYQSLLPLSVNDLPAEHPAHFALAYLRFVFDDDNTQLLNSYRDHWKILFGNQELVDLFIEFISIPHQQNLVTALIPKFLPNLANTLLAAGDKLAAIFFTKICQIIAPTSSDSFLAVGTIYLHLGFLENASRAIHEAAFRQVQPSEDVLWLTLSLYCRQKRFEEALEIANRLIQAKAMGFDGLGLYADILIRCQVDPATIESFLQEVYSHEGGTDQPVVKIAAYRLSLYKSILSTDDVLHEIRQTPELATHATGLYLQAHLLRDKNPELAYSLAHQALALAPFHPDAANWIEESASRSSVFEYMGLFLPSEHEGCAWPNDRQTELLRVIFSDTPLKMQQRWEAFLAHHAIERLDAGCYRLLPLLHNRQKNICLNANWLKQEMLKGVWKKSFLENSTRLKSIIALSQILEASGIHFQILKGLANAIMLYGDLGARPMTDIDILIKPDDLYTCHDILIKEGWATETPPSPQRLRFQYASTYLHPNGGNLDLHWRPAEEFTDDSYDPTHLGEPVKFSWMGQTLFTLNPTSNLACTILHGVAWNHLSPIRWISDALLLLKQPLSPIDWSCFESLAIRYHFKHVMIAGLGFLRRQFPDIAHLIPTHLVQSELTTDEKRLLDVRYRSRSEPASLEETIALARNLRVQFHKNNADQIWACGNHFTPQEVIQLTEHNIYWLPVYDSPVFESRIAALEAKNCLVIDANHNGYLRTVCRL